MKMIKDLSIDEIMFAIGVYPSLQATEKYSLFVELVVDHFKEEIDEKVLVQANNIKKLSMKKKAFFLSFLKDLSIEKEMTRYKENNIEWIHLLSAEYPDPLKQIYAPPVVLFYKGQIEWLKQKTWLGVVGARADTSYGKEVVAHIVKDIIHQSKQEIAIVSGLAKGIDTEAHVHSLKNKGQTVGVIGTGLDVFYPYANRALQEFLSAEHLVITEYPMGSKPLKFHFPERNRIIAGLSRGVLVVEAKKRSGSLITAYNALDEGRDVFAVPGSIFEENRAGNHRLIQLGAILTQDSGDILKEWFFI